MHVYSKRRNFFFLRNPSTINPPQAKYLKRLINILNSFSLATKFFSFYFNENIPSFSTHQITAISVKEMECCASVQHSICVYLKYTSKNRKKNVRQCWYGCDNVWMVLAYDAACSGGLCIILYTIWRPNERTNKKRNIVVSWECGCCRVHAHTLPSEKSKNIHSYMYINNITETRTLNASTKIQYSCHIWTSRVKSNRTVLWLLHFFHRNWSEQKKEVKKKKKKYKAIFINTNVAADTKLKRSYVDGQRYGNNS